MLTYPIQTIILEEFLQHHKYTPFIDDAWTEYANDVYKVEVPHLFELTKNQVDQLLQHTNLNIEQFEGYVMYLKGTNAFDKLIEVSKKSFTLKK